MRVLSASGSHRGDLSILLVGYYHVKARAVAVQTQYVRCWLRPDTHNAGVFQAYYQQDILQHKSASDISWIGSLQSCLFIIGTVVVGPLFDLGYLRSTLTVGTILTVFGTMMTSLCQEYWQFILAQGVCTGLGMTCLFD